MKRDPVESTRKYCEAMKKIQPELDILDKHLDEQGGMGTCHIFWGKKKEL